MLALNQLSPAQWQLVIDNQKLVNWKLKPYRSRLNPEVLSRLEIRLQNKLEEVAASYNDESNSADERNAKFTAYYSRCVGRDLLQFFAAERRAVAAMEEVKQAATDCYCEVAAEETTATTTDTLLSLCQRAAKELGYCEERLQLSLMVLRKEISSKIASRQIGLTRQGMDRIVNRLVERVQSYGNPLAA